METQEIQSLGIESYSDLRKNQKLRRLRNQKAAKETTGKIENSDRNGQGLKQDLELAL